LRAARSAFGEFLRLFCLIHSQRSSLPSLHSLKVTTITLIYISREEGQMRNRQAGRSDGKTERRNLKN
jgi:hypothetical protein